MDAPQYGPMFRFTDASVYWALHLLSDGKRVGRKRLAEMIGVGKTNTPIELALKPNSVVLLRSKATV